MPRAIWSGSISFGLVNAPVRMYSAIDENDLELHLVHEKDGSPIGYEKVCKKEGKEVPADEIVKAYEVADGELVYLEDDDFAAAEEEGYRTIQVLDFVQRDDIDPIVFQRSYYLGPAEGADKVYLLLLRAMEESGLSAVVEYVFHQKQQLGCLRVRDGVIVLEAMYFADEIRPVKGIAPKRSSKVDKKELEMAQTLIDRFTSDFEHGKYEDKYRKRLLKIVKQKQKGEEVHARTPEKEKAPTDLLEALRASVDAAKGQRNGRKKTRAPKRRAPRARTRR
ncbi:MAG: Ku protein [Actinobacteria bacterium]|nr:Ku protein [Actinomycetota bacterium]